MLICRDLSRLQLQLAWCGTVLLESHYDLPLLASLRAASNIAGSIEYFGDLETAAQDWFWFAIQFRTIEKQQWKTTHSKTLGSNLAKTIEKTSTNQTQMSLARDGNSQPALFFSPDLVPWFMCWRVPWFMVRHVHLFFVCSDVSVLVFYQFMFVLLSHCVPWHRAWAPSNICRKWRRPDWVRDAVKTNCVCAS